jgi:hypothetical protein
MRFKNSEFRTSMGLPLLHKRICISLAVRPFSLLQQPYWNFIWFCFENIGLELVEEVPKPGGANHKEWARRCPLYSLRMKHTHPHFQFTYNYNWGRTIRNTLAFCCYTCVCELTERSACMVKSYSGRGGAIIGTSIIVFLIWTNRKISSYTQLYSRPHSAAVSSVYSKLMDTFCRMFFFKAWCTNIPKCFWNWNNGNMWSLSC